MVGAGFILGPLITAQITEVYSIDICAGCAVILYGINMLLVTFFLPEVQRDKEDDKEKDDKKQPPTPLTWSTLLKHGVAWILAIRFLTRLVLKYKYTYFRA